jgi:hypothetical protein
LATKSLWSILTQDGLWRKIIVKKYIKLRNFLDWIKTLWKNNINFANQWKELLSFHVIGFHVVWKVGNGEHFIIGNDAILGCGDIIICLII